MLSLALLPLTIVQFQALFGFGGRPIRLDYLVFCGRSCRGCYRRGLPGAGGATGRRIPEDRGVDYGRLISACSRTSAEAADLKTSSRSPDLGWQK